MGSLGLEIPWEFWAFAVRACTPSARPESVYETKSPDGAIAATCTPSRKRSTVCVDQSQRIVTGISSAVEGDCRGRITGGCGGESMGTTSSSAVTRKSQPWGTAFLDPGTKWA